MQIRGNIHVIFRKVYNSFLFTIIAKLTYFNHFIQKSSWTCCSMVFVIVIVIVILLIDKFTHWCLYYYGIFTS